MLHAAFILHVTIVLHVTGSITPSLRRLAQHLVQRLRQCLRPKLVVVHVHQPAVRRDQVDQCTVVDRIRHALLGLLELLAIEPVAIGSTQLVGQGTDVLRAARQPHDPLVEEVDIAVQTLGVVVHRIDRHEHRHDGIGIFQRLHHLAVLEQRGRTDVRTGRIPNCQQQVFVPEAVLRDLALLVFQIERDPPAHHGLLRRNHRALRLSILRLGCTSLCGSHLKRPLPERHTRTRRQHHAQPGSHHPSFQHDKAPPEIHALKKQKGR